MISNTHSNPINQVQIYRASKGWKIFFAIMSPPLVALFGWFMVMPFLEGRSNEILLVIFCILFGGGFTIFFLYGLVAVFKERIEVCPDKIRVVSIFNTRELRIDGIKGFRIQANQNLILQPKDHMAKKIKTALIFERQSDLLEWLNQNLNNLDAQESQEELKQILDNTQLGQTVEQRRWVLDRARMWSRILNGAGYIAVFWGFFKPQPYYYLIWILVLLPIIVLGFVHHFDGVIKFDGERQSALPDIAPAFLGPSAVLAMRATIDFNILSWNNFWFHFALCSLSIYIMILLLIKDIRKRIATALILIFFCALYGFSSVITLNGILDTSIPLTYKVQVTEKRVCTGKHTSYYLKLSPWGTLKEAKEVDVGRSAYSRHEVGNTIDVVVRNGRFGIPWFYVQ